jgi:glycosyltransferase involved in cell wall biosynthesis
MPVYNEGGGIATVNATWQTVLSGLHIPYEVRVYDDGSTDDTGAVLDGLAERYPEMRVTHQSNRGHGPTVLRGYRDATGVWVFQVDVTTRFRRRCSTESGTAGRADAVFGACGPTGRVRGLAG